MTTTFPSGESPSTGCCTAADNWQKYDVDRRAAFTATNHHEFEEVAARTRNIQRFTARVVRQPCRRTESVTALGETFTAEEVRLYIHSALEHCLISCSNEMGNEVAGNLLAIRTSSKEPDDSFSEPSDFTRAINFLVATPPSQMPMTLSWLLNQFAMATAAANVETPEQLKRVELIRSRALNDSVMDGPIADVAIASHQAVQAAIELSIEAYLRMFRGEVK